MHAIPMNKRYLVTSHDAFNYFTRAYLATPAERLDGSWNKRFAAPEGLSPDGQLSAKDIQSILAYITAHHVKVIFPESNVSTDSLKKVVDAAEQKNLPVTLSDQSLYADSMGPPGSSGDTYLKMVQHNIDVVVKHLK
jgi:manganese/zinc/iron transport system substrate-binding protein